MQGPGPAVERLTLDTKDGSDELISVGPSLRGWVYRSSERPAFYRLLEMSEASLELRAECEAWIRKPRFPGLAPIVEARQAVGTDLFYVRYEILAERTLSEALADPDVSARLRTAARVANAIGDWWSRLGSGLFPMPADVVFGPEDSPHLLPLPWFRPPAIDSVLETPERPLYLAPEILRRRAAPDPDALDRYALGIGLLRCFYRPRPVAAEELLARVAAGSALSEEGLEDLLDGWQRRIPQIEKARAGVRRLVDPEPSTRKGVDLGELAALLADCSLFLDPARAVLQEEAEQGPREAFDLLQEILFEQETLDLLAAAGRLAMTLGLPMSAVDYLERAIGHNPLRELFELQLEAIFQLLEAGLIGELLAGTESSSRALGKLDAILWRDHARVGAERAGRFALPTVRYLLGTGDFHKAAGFVYPLLFDGDKYVWWRFELILAYAEAHIGMGKLDEAQEMLDDIEAKLAFVHRNKTVEPGEIRRHEKWVRQLRVRLEEARVKAGRGN